ncbi:MAG: NAD(P)H-hydrate dehydratase [Ruminococcus sp.]|nr:NAD(P)H-hydrate dehydratase [Ruminococcus sp.]
MRYLPDGAWMQKADAYTIQGIGVPSVVLMEHAAQSMISALEENNIDCSRTLIVCGSGNNGGDGFAIARLLYQKKNYVTVVFAGKESSMTEECRIQCQVVRNMGIPVVTEIPENEYSLVIDALFGVGLSREVGGHYAELIEQMNALSGTKAAVDIPSGVSAFSGKVLGIAFEADLTVTFQCEKIGCVMFPGKQYAGQVIVTDIGISTEIFAGKNEIRYTMDAADLKKHLPKRSQNTHKGSYGKVLMITGSKGMAGAAYLSAKAAYVCGAGLVQIYTDEANRTVLQQLLPEAIISTYEEYEEEKLKQLLTWADVVCMGCGLGQGTLSKKIFKAAMQYNTAPCVIDADGLNILSEHMELLKDCRTEMILTPHMKEMSVLLGCSVKEVMENRFELLEKFVNEYPAVCVLKDARTAVASKNSPVYVNTLGNQAMAKAGSGDVLAGTITGLLAGHLKADEAARTGVLLHACGGDEARDELGSYSVLAQNLICGIQRCLKKVEDK